MLTLADVIVGKAKKVDQQIIEIFRRNSEILAQLPFDDSQSAGTGGSTLAYGYLQTNVPSGAGTRAINSEYTNTEAKKKELIAYLKILGGSYKIDRVLAEAQAQEVAYQAEEKIKSTVNLWTNYFINGDSTVSGNLQFDGLKKLLAGSSTEKTSSSDLSVITDAALKNNAIKLCEEIDEVIMGMVEKPDLIIGNGKAIIKLRSAARMLGYLTATEDAFGRPTLGYNGIPFMEAKDYVSPNAGGTAAVETSIIPITAGKTDIYFVKFGRSTLHGVTIGGGKVITSRLPDFTKAGAVKEGDVEFVSCIALKNTRGAGVLKGVQVAPAT